MLILRLVLQIAVQAGSLKQVIQLSDEICDLPFLDILQEQVAFHFTTCDLQNAFKAMPSDEREDYMETFYANFPGWDLKLNQDAVFKNKNII